MKASNNHERHESPHFSPSRSDRAQRAGLKLLLMGKTDQETADTVGVTRETVWSWRRDTRFL